LQVTVAERFSGVSGYGRRSSAFVGVVPLLDMLKLFPHIFVALSRRMTALSTVEIVKELSLEDSRVAPLFADVQWFAKEAERIGLPLSAQQAKRVVQMWKNGDKEGVGRGAMELHNRVLDELETVCCYVVPREKTSYLEHAWPANPRIEDSFPSAIPEFKRAGRCFAYSENTACVFHLMRIVDLGLRSVAASLSVNYDARNWAGIAGKITKSMEQKYGDKTDAWKNQEHFYASVLADIQAISKAYRNEGIHDARKVYEEQDASYLLTVAEHLMTSLAGHGMKEEVL